MKVVLIGFMGAGKTTVGALLAQRLGMKLIEIDQLVADRSGFPSIAALVDAHGEPHFRDIESAVAYDLSNEDDVVVSTGGGIIGRPENRPFLVNDATMVVFLRTKFDSIRERLGEGEERPLFRDKDKALALFEKRQAVYEEWATVVIDTDERTPDDIASEISGKLGRP